MKNEIDALMHANDIDAILVTGPGQHNPAMVYLTGGGHMTTADLVKKRGEQGILFHNSMERDEAAKSGMVTIGYDQYPFKELINQTGGDQIEALALRYKKMLKKAGVTEGKIALYGISELGAKYAILTRLQKRMPNIELVGFSQDPILLPAMMTKDQNELERIRHMGRVTTGVVGRVAEFLSSQQVKNETLVDYDGKAITIGKVRSLINLWLAEGGAENPEGTIFAIGRDAGVPHSQGNNLDLLKLGQTIVFDIFPCEPGGGYYYDFTRTWSLGYATKETQQLYDQVKEVYDILISELEENKPFKYYQGCTCELFEAMGHTTVQSNPATQEGYVHSIGHGLGLHVHEMPFSGITAGENEVLARGSVFTIEPGLYYPEKGMGVRLEDSYFINDQGLAERFVDYPMDLVLPIKG